MAKHVKIRVTFQYNYKEYVLLVTSERGLLELPGLDVNEKNAQSESSKEEIRENSPTDTLEKSCTLKCLAQLGLTITDEDNLTLLKESKEIETNIYCLNLGNITKEKFEDLKKNAYEYDPNANKITLKISKFTENMLCLTLSNNSLKNSYTWEDLLSQDLINSNKVLITEIDNATLGINVLHEILLDTLTQDTVTKTTHLTQAELIAWWKRIADTSIDSKTAAKYHNLLKWPQTNNFDLNQLHHGVSSEVWKQTYREFLQGPFLTRIRETKKQIIQQQQKVVEREINTSNFKKNALQETKIVQYSAIPSLITEMTEKHLQIAEGPFTLNHKESFYQYQKEGKEKTAWIGVAHNNIESETLAFSQKERMALMEFPLTPILLNKEFAVGNGKIIVAENIPNTGKVHPLLHEQSSLAYWQLYMFQTIQTGAFLPNQSVAMITAVDMSDENKTAQYSREVYAQDFSTYFTLFYNLKNSDHTKVNIQPPSVSCTHQSVLVSVTLQAIAAIHAGWNLNDVTFHGINIDEKTRIEHFLKISAEHLLSPSQIYDELLQLAHTPYSGRFRPSEIKPLGNLIDWQPKQSIPIKQNQAEQTQVEDARDTALCLYALNNGKLDFFTEIKYKCLVAILTTFELDDNTHKFHQLIIGPLLEQKLLNLNEIANFITTIDFSDPYYKNCRTFLLHLQPYFVPLKQAIENSDSLVVDTLLKAGQAVTQDEIHAALVTKNVPLMVEVFKKCKVVNDEQFKEALFLSAKKAEIEAFKYFELQLNPKNDKYKKYSLFLELAKQGCNDGVLKFLVSEESKTEFAKNILGNSLEFAGNNIPIFCNFIKGYLLCQNLESKSSTVIDDLFTFYNSNKKQLNPKQTHYLMRSRRNKNTTKFLVLPEDVKTGFAAVIDEKNPDLFYIYKSQINESEFKELCVISYNKLVEFYVDFKQNPEYIDLTNDLHTVIKKIIPDFSDTSFLAVPKPSQDQNPKLSPLELVKSGRWREIAPIGGSDQIRFNQFILQIADNLSNQEMLHHLLLEKEANKDLCNFLFKDISFNISARKTVARYLQKKSLLSDNIDLYSLVGHDCDTKITETEAVNSRAWRILHKLVTNNSSKFSTLHDLLITLINKQRFDLFIEVYKSLLITKNKFERNDVKNIIAAFKRISPVTSMHRQALSLIAKNESAVLLVELKFLSTGKDKCIFSTYKDELTQVLSFNDVHNKIKDYLQTSPSLFHSRHKTAEWINIYLSTPELPRAEAIAFLYNLYKNLPHGSNLRDAVRRTLMASLEMSPASSFKVFKDNSAVLGNADLIDFIAAAISRKGFPDPKANENNKGILFTSLFKFINATETSLKYKLSNNEGKYDSINAANNVLNALHGKLSVIKAEEYLLLIQDPEVKMRLTRFFKNESNNITNLNFENYLTALALQHMATQNVKPEQCFVEKTNGAFKLFILPKDENINEVKKMFPQTLPSSTNITYIEFKDLHALTEILSSNPTSELKATP